MFGTDIFSSSQNQINDPATQSANNPTAQLGAIQTPTSLNPTPAGPMPMPYQSAGPRAPTREGFGMFDGPHFDFLDNSFDGGELDAAMHHAIANKLSASDAFDLAHPIETVATGAQQSGMPANPISAPFGSNWAKPLAIDPRLMQLAPALGLQGGQQPSLPPRSNAENTAAGLQSLQALMPSDQYNQLALQLHQELANQPAYPHTSPPTLSPIAAALGALGALLGGKFASQNVQGTLEGGTQANENEFQRQLQRYQSEEQGHRERLSTLSDLLGQQSERDKAVYADQQENARQTDRNKLTASEDLAKANAAYQLAISESGTGSEILRTGQYVQGIAKRNGIPGAPTDADINNEIRKWALRVGGDLRQSIRDQAKGILGLTPEEQRQSADQIAAFGDQILGTDGKPVLEQSELPSIPNGQEIAAMRQKDANDARLAAQQEFGTRFVFKNPDSVAHERNAWVKLGDESNQLTKLQLIAATKPQSVNDAIRQRTAIEKLGELTSQFDRDTSEIRAQVVSRYNADGAQVAKLQQQAAKNPKLEARLRELQLNQGYWQSMIRAIDDKRTPAGLRPVYEDEQKAIDAIRASGKDSPILAQHFQNKWGIPPQ